MLTRHLTLRPLLVGSMAVLFALFLALGGASVAHAQLPDVLPEDPEAPESPESGGLLDGLTEGELLELQDLLGLTEEELLELENLTLEELLALLDLLDTEDPAPAPDPVPAPVAPAPPPAVPAAAPAPAAPQVTQRPVGGVAAGAGGASDQGASSVPLLALGALALAGAGAAVRQQAAQV